MARRRIRGDRSFRRILAKMPEAIREEMLTMMDQAGDEMLAIQKANAPQRTGAVQRALSKRLLRGTLKLRVGLVGKPINRKLFYARIVELGRKPQTVVAIRNSVATLKTARAYGGRSNNYKALALSKKLKGAYSMKIKGMAPRPFIRSAKVTAVRDTMGGRLDKFWGKALARASKGVTDA